jgi:mRNA interferase RelE/StbE
VASSKKGSRNRLIRYEVEIKKSALKSLKEIPKRDQLRISGIIDSLAENPLPPKALKLTGRDGYRIRVGKYRIIYTFNNRVFKVLVIQIGHRKNAYSLDT